MSASLEASAAAGTDDIEVPFELTVREEAEAAETCVLRCDQILRYLPGRRLVVRTLWAGQPAVLKLFMGDGALSYRDRELGGLELLRAAGVQVPRQLALVEQLVSPAVKAGARVPAAVGIVTGFLSDAHNVRWQDADAVDALVRLFALLHSGGITHTDPHLDNFLVAGGRLYVVDCDGIRGGKRALSERSSLRNLGQLLAQLAPAADHQIDGLIGGYREARGWPVSNASATVASVRARRWLAAARDDRYRRYLKKTRRACSEFDVLQDARSLRARVRDSDTENAAEFFAAPDDLLSKGQILKAGNSATVARWVKEGDHRAASLVIKRYNVKGPAQALRRSLSPLPRFRRAWSYGALLHLLDIPTARPLALLEKGLWRWRSRAWLLLEDLGDRDLGVEMQDALAQGDESRVSARIDEVVGLFAALRAAGLVHGDTKVTNFLVHENVVHLIDLDAMTLLPAGSRVVRRGAAWADFERDIARFLDNWDEPLRARFDTAFRAAGLL